VDVDAAAPLNPGDLYWSGWIGPNCELWTELGDAGGFFSSPARGTNSFWTPYDANNPDSMGAHGQWMLNYGLSSLALTNGSWIGLSVAAGEFEYDTMSPYFTHKTCAGGTGRQHHLARQKSRRRISRRPVAGAILELQQMDVFAPAFSRFAELDQRRFGNPGNDTNLVLRDTNSPADKAFYRVKAEQP